MSKEMKPYKLSLGNADASLHIEYDEHCDETAQLVICSNSIMVKIYDFSREDLIEFGKEIIAFAQNNPAIPATPAEWKKF